ncbi:hypothetical protein MG290_10555 [Flavobacterium sp. CBA20B-1]|uniref:hypothetical protein n=1 Tax=unclassified Flavobacterium TaxID=196869 RepID=UPI002225A24A|nr:MULTISPECIES: hypothetical protein [unclassified Flavobacterium]WCM41397.1 hypothetical protein MG290_10555 [Flavobacterium sp. CBA20B-1]
MEKRLNNQQIEQLFTFTKKHFVEHYDVQVELVDHLANAIEDQWKENPNILFEDALQTEFKKFSIFGFTSLVEQKQAALQNHYSRLIKKELIAFFSVPKIIFSAALFYILFQIFSNPNEWMVANDYVILIGIVAITVAVFVYQRVSFKTPKKWLIQNTANYLYTLPISLLIYFRFGFTTSTLTPSLFKVLFSTTISTLYILFLIVLYSKIIPMVKNEIIQTEKRFQFA